MRLPPEGRKRTVYDGLNRRKRWTKTGYQRSDLRRAMALKFVCGQGSRFYNAQVFMRSIKFLAVALFTVSLSYNAEAASVSIKKVLPQLLDAKGRNSLYPSLYHRDAYQLFLRNHPEERSGLRFAVLWSAPRGKELILRVELRGSKEETLNASKLELPVKRTGWFRTWTSLDLRGDDYKKLGDLVASRATLWDGDKLVGEQKSFLW